MTDFIAIFSYKWALECVVEFNDCGDRPQIYYPSHNTVSKKSCWFRGRIYNQTTLMKKLGMSEDASTDELISQGYRTYGYSFLTEIDGEIVYLLYDPQLYETVVGRDSSGRYGLYYSNHNNKKIVSTTLRYINNGYQLDDIYALHFLLFKGNVDHLSRSPFLEISAVKPGQIIKFPGNYKISSWEIKTPVDYTRYRSVQQYYDEFELLLNRAIDKRVFGYTKIMCEQSGGIDSSSISAILVKKHCELDRLQTISLVYDYNHEADESRIIHELIRELHVDNISINGDELWLYKDFKNMLLPFIDEPTVDVGYYPIRKAFSEYAQAYGCQLLISGHGGDHVVDNTPICLCDALSGLQINNFKKQLKYWLKVFSNGQNMNAGQLLLNFVLLPIISASSLPLISGSGYNMYSSGRGRILNYLSKVYMENAKEIVGKNNPYKLSREKGCFDIQINSLSATHNTSLRWVSRIDSQYGIYREFPYMDKQLIEFLLSVPPEIKTNENGKKRLQKEALLEYLPICIQKRENHAIFTFLTYLGVSKEYGYLVDLLNDSQLVELGVIDPKKMIAFLNRTRGGAPMEDLCDLWGLVGYEIWCKTINAYRNVDRTSDIMKYLKDALLR